MHVETGAVHVQERLEARCVWMHVESHTCAGTSAHADVVSVKLHVTW